MKNLERLAQTIPSMGGYEIGKYLRTFAALTKPSECVVEIGTWLGAGTAQMCLGIMDSGSGAEIHCYDIFKVYENHLEKAKKRGLELTINSDLLPITRSYLDSFGVDIKYHRCNVSDSRPPKKMIKLYVDDACKSAKNFDHCMKEFSPYFIRDVTTIVLMDYFYYEKKPCRDHEYQHLFMERNRDRVKFVSRPRPDLSCAIFTYTGTQGLW